MPAPDVTRIPPTLREPAKILHGLRSPALNLREPAAAQPATRTANSQRATGRHPTPPAELATRHPRSWIAPAPHQAHNTSTTRHQPQAAMEGALSLSAIRPPAGGEERSDIVTCRRSATTCGYRVSSRRRPPRCKMCRKNRQIVVHDEPRPLVLPAARPARPRFGPRSAGGPKARRSDPGWRGGSWTLST
jgi:hypothetical protein